MHNTTPTQAHASPDVMTLVNELTKACMSDTMESELLRKQCTRKLYKLLGDPTETDFPDEFETAEVSYFGKRPGYTQGIAILNAEFMRTINGAVTDWRVKRPSATKVAIVRRYTRGGWHCKVQAFNVSCYKYAPHPRFPHVWVRFISTRDTAQYEYVLEKRDDSNA